MEDILKEILFEIKGIKSDISSLKSDVSSLKSDVNSLKSDVSGMKSTLNEHTQILRALEHSSQVNKAEHDLMMNDIACIMGDVVCIKKDMYRVEEATANNWADIAKLKSIK